MDNNEVDRFLQTTDGTINALVCERNEINNSITRVSEQLNKIAKSIAALEEARIAINNEIRAIQETLKEDIDSLVTIALQIVYEGRNVEFTMDFDRTPAGNSQYKPFIVENGEKYNPKDEQCGGALDVISYAMRIVLFTFEHKQGNRFMFFDEPFKFLGGGLYANRAAIMAAKINADLKIQSIMISHDEQTIGTADKIYNVDHNGKSSTALMLDKHTTLPIAKEKVKRIQGPKRIKA